MKVALHYVKAWQKPKPKSKRGEWRTPTQADMTPIPRSDIITIDLPASAIVFTEDDGTPINQTKCAHIPKSVKKAPVKQSNIKYIEWDFGFGEFCMENSFHIHRMPKNGNAVELIPTNTLDATSKSMLPRPKTEPYKQYYCIMIYGEVYGLDKPPKTFEDFVIHSAKKIGVDEAKARLRGGNDEAVFKGSGFISKAIGHRYAIHQSNDTMKTRYMFQLIMDPSSLTML